MQVVTQDKTLKIKSIYVAGNGGSHLKVLNEFLQAASTEGFTPNQVRVVSFRE
jgi:hypothetical protein